MWAWKRFITSMHNTMCHTIKWFPKLFATTWTSKWLIVSVLSQMHHNMNIFPNALPQQDHSATHYVFSDGLVDLLQLMYCKDLSISLWLDMHICCRYYTDARFLLHRSYSKRQTLSAAATSEVVKISCKTWIFIWLHGHPKSKIKTYLGITQL